MVRAGRRGQTWSLDLIIAVVIFIAVVASFYAFLSRSTTEDEAILLQDSAKTIGRRLNCDVATSGSECFLENGRIDTQSLDDLSDLTYDQLKNQLDIEDEFCIFIRDVDGNLIPIEDTNNGRSLSGLGSNTLILSGSIRCNTPI